MLASAFCHSLSLQLISALKTLATDSGIPAEDGSNSSTEELTSLDNPERSRIYPSVAVDLAPSLVPGPVGQIGKPSYPLPDPNTLAPQLPPRSAEVSPETLPNSSPGETVKHFTGNADWTKSPWRRTTVIRRRGGGGSISSDRSRSPSVSEKNVRPLGRECLIDLLSYIVCAYLPLMWHFGLMCE